jgi:hypothetical protein
MKFADKIYNIFSKCKYVNKLNFYGSIEKGTDDKYSDVDLEIWIKDYKSFYKIFESLLKDIDDFYIIFEALIEDNLQVFTVIWKNHSLYKKLDLRVNTPADKKYIKSLNFFNENSRIFYDIYIGLIRYVKYRMRNDPKAEKFYLSSLGYFKKVCHEKNHLNFPGYFSKDERVMYMHNVIYKKLGLLNPEFAKNVLKFARNELKRTGN